MTKDEFIEATKDDICHNLRQAAKLILECPDRNALYQFRDYDKIFQLLMLASKQQERIEVLTYTGYAEFRKE